MDHYNQERPHQSLGDATPQARFRPDGDAGLGSVAPIPAPRVPQRDGDQWVSRKVAANGVVCVGHQQVSVGKNFAGCACDVPVTGQVLQFWVGNQLVKTAARTQASTEALQGHRMFPLVRDASSAHRDQLHDIRRACGPQ